MPWRLTAVLFIPLIEAYLLQRPCLAVPGSYLAHFCGRVAVGFIGDWYGDNGRFLLAAGLVCVVEDCTTRSSHSARWGMWLFWLCKWAADGYCFNS